jgi:CRISPR/Cas system-associated exonuclease Cas4 (RecB family)
MGIVFSPSNLSTHVQCPRKFWGQSIAKTLKWKASQQKSRGTLVHNALEKAVKDGFDAVKTWPDGLDMDFVRQQVGLVQGLTMAGMSCYIEHEMCVDGRGNPVDWWDDKGAMRCKADTILVPPEGTELPMFLIDYKTGKKWDDEDMQLRMEALIAHLYYKHPVVQYAYWYVDSGETATGIIDFRNGMEPVQDILDALVDAQQDMNANDFPPRKNRFCKWCGFYNTPECGL